VQIETRKVYDVLAVGMSGRLDTTTSGDANDRMVAIAQGEDKQVVLNLERLEYASSAGLRVILPTSKLLQGAHGELKICNAGSVVKDVLKTSGFNSLLKMYSSEKEAVAAFSK
jgi:anti-anti-sigma factor